MEKHQPSTRGTRAPQVVQKLGVSGQASQVLYLKRIWIVVVKVKLIAALLLYTKEQTQVI